MTGAVSDDSQEQDPISYVPDVPDAETLEQAASARVNIAALASSLGDATSRRQPPPPGGPTRISGRTQGARAPLYNNQEHSEVTFPSFAEAIANVKKAVRITSTTPRSASRSGRRRGRYRQTSQSASALPPAQPRSSPTRGQPIAPAVPQGAQQVPLQQAPQAPLILAQQAGQRHAAALAAGRGRAPTQGIPSAVAQVLQEGGAAIPVSSRGASRFRGGSLDPGRFSGSGRGRGSSRSFPRAPSRGSNTGFSGRPSASRGGQGQGRGRGRGRKQSIPSSIQIATPEDILAQLRQTAPASASSSAGPAATSQTSSAASQQVSPLAPFPSSAPVATSQAQPTADPRLQFVTADEAAAFAASLSANNGPQPEGVGQIPSPSAPTQPTILLGSNIARASGSGALTRTNPSRRRGGYGGSAVYREGKSISGSKDQPTNPNHAKIFIVSPPRSSASRRGGNKKSSRGRTHSKFNLEAYLAEKRRQGEVLDISPTILSRQPSQIPTATVAPTSPRTPTAEQRPQRPQQVLQTALGPQAIGESPLQSGQVHLPTQQPPNGFSGPPQVQQVAGQGYPRRPAQDLRPQIRQPTARIRQKSQYARPVPTTPSTPRPTTARQVIQYAPKVSPTPGSRPRLTDQQLLQRQSARTPGPVSYGSPPPRAGYDRQGPRPRRPTTPAASPVPPPSPVSPPSDVQFALQTESPDEEYNTRKPQERVRRPPSNREAVSSGARTPETFAKRGRKPKTSPKPDVRQQVESQVQRGVLQFTAQQQSLGQQTSKPPAQVLQQISEQNAVIQEEQAPQTQILGGVAPVIGPQTASQLQVIGQGLISQAGAAAQTAILQEQSISQSGVARLQVGAQPEAPIQQATDQGESVNIQTAARVVTGTSSPPQEEQSQQYEDTQPTSAQHLEVTYQRRNQNAPVEQLNSNQQRSNGVGLSRQDVNERLQDQRLRNEAVAQQQLLQQQILVQQLLQQQEPQPQPQPSAPDPRTVKQRSGSRGSRRFSAGQFNTALEQFGDAPFQANEQQYSPRISAKSAYDSSTGSIPVTERASTAGVTARNAATVYVSKYAPRTALLSREPPVAIYTPSTGTTVHITSSPQPSPAAASSQAALPPPALPSAAPQGADIPFTGAFPPPVDIPAPAPPSAAPPPRASTPPPRASTPPPFAVPPPAPTTPAPPPTPPPTKYSDRFRNRYSARKLADIEAGFDKVRRGRKLSDRALLDKELEMVEVSLVENLPQERRSVGTTRRFKGRRRNASVRRGSEVSENISSRRGFGIRRGVKPTKLPGDQNKNRGLAPSSSAELRKVDENDQELERAASKPLVRRVVVKRRGEQQRRRNQPSNDNRARAGQGRGEAKKRMQKEQRKRLEYASNLEDVPWELAHLLSPAILPYRRDEMESPSLITQLSILESVMKSVKEEGGRTGRLFIPDGSKSITQSLQSQSPSRNRSRIQYLPAQNDQVSTKLSKQEYSPQPDQTAPRKKLSYLPEPSRGSSLSSSNRGYLPEPGERPPNPKESPLSEQSARRTSTIAEERGYLPLSGFIELPQEKVKLRKNQICCGAGFYMERIVRYGTVLRHGVGLSTVPGLSMERVVSTLNLISLQSVNIL